MENGTYRPLIISLNSAAEEVARLRKYSRKPPPSPASENLIEENMDDKYTHSEENNVIIKL